MSTDFTDGYGGQPYTDVKGMGFDRPYEAFLRERIKRFGCHGQGDRNQRL